ncbi:MAG: wax ester/triacylglycerol synthase domain-containing protein, partial [Stenotrophobium sp.]
MKRMNPLDASWLSVDSHDTPMHVGNLQVFSLPKGAPDDFVQQWVTTLKA